MLLSAAISIEISAHVNYFEKSKQKKKAILRKWYELKLFVCSLHKLAHECDSCDRGGFERIIYIFLCTWFRPSQQTKCRDILNAKTPPPYSIIKYSLATLIANATRSLHFWFQRLIHPICRDVMLRFPIKLHAHTQLQRQIRVCINGMNCTVYNGCISWINNNSNKASSSSDVNKIYSKKHSINQAKWARITNWKLFRRRITKVNNTLQSICVSVLHIYYYYFAAE